MSYNPGDRVGDYEIVDVLGAGGMGKVYKVRNVISDRVEAMKVLLPNLQSDPDLADRFMREIKVQARLQHAHIAALHTALRVNNQLLMLIEFVEGTSLEAVLRQGAVPVGKAVEYIRQVLLALAYAHQSGIVHRDIKPANMMLTPAGTVKLMDFGIARLAADQRLTQTGRTVGSLYYMSPEQIQGAIDLDARSDIYSLGVSLYELVTARRPFQGDSDYSIMAAHLSSRPVPPIELDPSLPPPLNEVILMAIAKDPAQRFQSADAFRMALESVVAAPAVNTQRTVPPPQEQTAKPASRRGLYMAVGSLATVAVLVLAAVQGPKLFAPSSAAPAVSQSPAATPAPAPVAESAPIVPSPAVETPVSSQVAAPIASTPQTRAGKLSQVSVGVDTAAAQPAAPQQTAAAAPAQVVQPQAVPQQAPAQAATPAPRTAELQSARETLMLLATRANSARTTLASLKQQQARMGTGLRGDILTAEQRMELYLDEAQGAVKAGDPDKAQSSLKAAERALEAVEKFLGR